MDRYSIKMRASNQDGGRSHHISGAEKIVSEEELELYVSRLLKRAMHHSKGKPDFVNIKIEAVKEEEILHLNALPVTTVETETEEEGRIVVRSYLEKLGIVHIDEIFSAWTQTYSMRGAMLLDIETLKRLEPDRSRGVRTTYMDMETGEETRRAACSGKNHFNEALVLATKVVNHPAIAAEICISDDPDYVTGYIASKKFGYVRITNLKPMGSPNGGRIFLFRGDDAALADCIDYLQKKKVLVHMPGSRQNGPAAEDGRKQGETNKWNWMEESLQEWKRRDLYRTMKVLDSPQNTHVRWNGRDMLMLASNAYLDLCNEERIKAYTAKIMEEYGTGSGGARLTTGTTRLHMELEEAIARFKGREAALVFNTGFAANTGIIPAVCREQDVIFSDELNHASIIDGCRQAKARTIVYRHNDMADLEEKIRESGCESGLIVSDAVFSMDGDIVNLPGLVRLAEKYGLFSMIDEAHATGVIGETGRGCEEYFHMEGSCDILMGTLSKAVGAEGGYVCGSHTLIEYLKNKGRSFIFSTALSPVTIAAAQKGIEILETEPHRSRQLQENVRWFCTCLQKQGLNVHSDTAIIPIRVGDEGKAMEAAGRLMEQGYFIPAIRYPTVKKGEAILRAALMSSHTREELEAAAAAIARTIDEVKAL